MTEDQPEAPPIIRQAIWLWHNTHRHRSVLVKPPVLVALLVVAAAAYFVGGSASSELIKLKDERIAFLGDQVAAYKERLGGATPDQAAKEIGLLRDRLSTQQVQIDQQKKQLAALAGTVWERLTNVQIGQLSEQIRSLATGEKRIAIQCPSPRQCGEFSNSLLEAFQRGGWDAISSEAAVQHSGLWLFPYNKDSKALQSALTPILGTIGMDDSQREGALDPSQRYWLAIGEKVP